MSASSEPERFRALLDLVRLPAGGGAEVVYAPLSREAHFLPPDRVRLLLACRAPATIDEHAARIAGADRPRDAVRAALVELAAQGLLVGESWILERVRSSARDDAPPPIATLAIPTRSRAVTLRRALASYAENTAAHGRSIELLVADGASTPEAEAETLAAMSGARSSYAGPRERARFIDELARHAGVDPALVAFAIDNPMRCPIATGANRNAILLHTAGDLHVQTDDDTIAAIAAAPACDAALALSSHNDPTELWFDPQSPFEAQPPFEAADFCRLHEELLGKSPGDCAVAAASGVDVATASGLFLRRLAPRGGTVLSTQLGGAGDSATDSMFHYLVLSGRSRERLLISEDAYRRAFVGRRVLRVAPRRTIVDGSFCMAMSLGLDNRALLPPFFPVQRNGDGVLGVVLRVAFHDAYQGFLPWAIAHEPLHRRPSTFDDHFASLEGMTTGDLVCHLALGSRVEAKPGDPAAGLRSLGATFVRWASAPRADFEEIVRLHALRARSRDLVLLDDVLKVFDRAPAYWARDVERTASIFRTAVTRPSVGFPVDLVAAFGESEGRALFQRLVRTYGELLGAWPDLVVAAKELRARDVRLARPYESSSG